MSYCKFWIYWALFIQNLQYDKYHISTKTVQLDIHYLSWYTSSGIHRLVRLVPLFFNNCIFTDIFSYWFTIVSLRKFITWLQGTGTCSSLLLNRECVEGDWMFGQNGILIEATCNSRCSLLIHTIHKRSFSDCSSRFLHVHRLLLRTKVFRLNLLNISFPCFVQKRLELVKI